MRVTFDYMNPNVRSMNYGVLFFIYLSTFILTRNCCGCLLLTLKRSGASDGQLT